MTFLSALYLGRPKDLRNNLNSQKWGVTRIMGGKFQKVSACRGQIWVGRRSENPKMEKGIWGPRCVDPSLNQVGGWVEWGTQTLRATTVKLFFLFLHLPRHPVLLMLPSSLIYRWRNWAQRGGYLLPPSWFASLQYRREGNGLGRDETRLTNGW